MNSNIISQSLKNSIIVLIGIFLGFVTAGLIYPNLLKTEEIGILGILFGLAYVISELCSFGLHNIVTKMFPYFRNESKEHNGFVLVIFSIVTAGSIMSVLLLKLIENLLTTNVFHNQLFDDYYILLYPLVIFTIVFNALDNYYKVLYNITAASFLKEVLYRLIAFFLMFLVFIKLIDFRQFIYLYILGYSIPLGLLIFKLFKNNHFYFNLKYLHIPKKLRKEIVLVGAFGIIVGICVSANLNIDKIIVGSVISMEDLGIYTTSFIYGSIIGVPGRSITKIMSVYFSEAWKKMDLPTIDKYFKSSSIYQTVIGAFLFLLLWSNIDSLYFFLPEKYEQGKFVLFFFALSGFIEMISGSVNPVLYSSPDYKYQAFANVLYLILIVVFGYFFAKVWGMVGVAIGMTFAMSIYQGLRILFVYTRYGIQPFSFKHIQVLFLTFLIYTIQYLIPQLPIPILDLFIRSVIVSFLFIFLLINFYSFPDIEHFIEKFIPVKIFRIGFENVNL